MVICARGCVRKRNQKFHRIYLRLSRRIGKRKAIVAIARKMLTVIFALLTQDVDYVEMDKESYAEKIRRMDCRARALEMPHLTEQVMRLSPGTLKQLSAEDGG